MSTGKGRVAFALLSLYFIWGSTYLAIRWALAAFPPFALAGLRFLLAGTGLFLALRLRGARGPTRAELWGALPVGFLLLSVGNGGMVYAEQWVSSGLASVVIASVPLWTALFSGLFGKWPRPIEWIGLAFGAAGVGLLNSHGDLRSDPRSAAILLTAAAAWAFGSVIGKRLPRAPGLMASATQMIWGGICLLLASLVFQERLLGMVTPRPLIALVYLAVVGSVIAFSAYNFLLRTVSPALATSYAFVNPSVALLLGVAFAGEHVSRAALIAMGLILAGVALVTLGREQRPAT